jgi:acetyl-CoA carboxylase biotin carboxyl carrier protein
MPDPKKTNEDIFDLDRIRRLVELMKEHDLGEVDLQQDEQRIRLTRTSQQVQMAMPIAAHAPVAAQPVAAAQPAAPAADGEHIAIIKSPMVGTFYTKPNPNSKPFVEVGSVVQAETPVCMIEAMKVFNEIPAEIRGKIVAVLVQNEEAVDFGKPLFKVDTRG